MLNVVLVEQVFHIVICTSDIGTFGSTTAQAVRDAGLRLDLEAPTVQAPSMTAALDMFIKENNK